MNNEYDEVTPGQDDVYVDAGDEYQDEFDLIDNRPGWTKPVGILSIVFGSISVFCGGAGVVSLAVAVPMGRNFFQQQGEPIPPTMYPNMAQYGSYGVSIALNVLLVVAGIMTLSRKLAARPVHLVYAVLMLLLLLWSMQLAYSTMITMDQWCADNPDSMGAAQRNRGVEIGMAFASIAISLVWPIFCLVWFGLLKKTEDDFTGGVLEAAA